jgi:eukaryotic-like serine/threonine-protein kinase
LWAAGQWVHHPGSMVDEHALTMEIPEAGSDALFADRYRILARLGEGGMGAVFRALDRDLDEEIALKVLRREIAADREAIERFRREVKLARRVTHPNVARTFDFGMSDGVCYLTMELIDGASLSRRIASGPLPLADVLRVALEIALGLHAAHSVGVIHRDLKPDNVMAAGDRVVITDFGIARSSRGEPSHTRGTVTGTPAYMAPEQLEGRELDGRADVYALGVAMFEMLTGELPFVGDSAYAIAAARLTRDPPDPRSFVPGLPDAIAELVLSAMARRREERPNAQAFAKRVESLRSGHSTPSGILSLSASSRISVSSETRVVLTALDGGSELASVGEDLSAALGDAIAAMPGLRVVTVPRKVEDPTELGRELQARVVLAGAVRKAGGSLRVRIRAHDARDGSQLWSELIDGQEDDFFALEDAVSAKVCDALRTFVAEASGRRGPRDPEIRAIYDRAFELTSTLRGVREGRAMLEESLKTWPRDPWLMTSLARILNYEWNNTFRVDDNSLIARAEELSLASLRVDSSLAESYSVIGMVRIQSGEYRAAVRAFRDAIARAPLEVTANRYMFQLLSETGHERDAYQLLDLLEQTARVSLTACLTMGGDSSEAMGRVRLLALAGERATAESILARELEKSPAACFHICRYGMWWKDDAAAAAGENQLSRLDAPAVHFWLRPLIDTIRGHDGPISYVDELHSSHASLRRKTYLAQLATECYAQRGRIDDALAMLQQAASWALIDVLWLDRCPALDALRGHDRFGRIRAAVSSRASAMWE